MPPTIPDTFKCYLVDRADEGPVTAGVTQRRVEELPKGDVLIRVAYSSLNYKDAMAATGHRGIVRRFPHVPGVDAAGAIAASESIEFKEGDEVLVTGFDMGSTRWGGWGELIRVPHNWVVPRPKGLSLREAMILGTAGLTAALCVDVLQKHEVRPESGTIVVTGATGGVGSVSVAILAKLGYDVAAVTGKAASHDYLKGLGASKILGREDVDDRSGRPLLTARWAGGVDTVGGNILGTLLRSVAHGGCVTACGLAASNELPITVYPFILRAVRSPGLTPPGASGSRRRKCGGGCRVSGSRLGLETMARFTTLADIAPLVDAMLAGRMQGRVVVDLASANQ